MKTITLLLMYSMFLGNMRAQKDIAYIYSNPHFFAGQSIVFTDAYNPPILLPSGVRTFTPTVDEIMQAEQLLSSRYNEDLKAYNFFKPEKNVRKKYFKYKRQYLGYIDQDGHKNIIMNLLNFKHKIQARKKFEGWESTYLVGFGDYYEKNIRTYEIDITYKTLKLG